MTIIKKIIEVLNNKLKINYYYFKWFFYFNSFLIFLLLISKIILVPNNYVIATYVFIILTLAIFTKLNFELRKPWAGIGGTLLIIYISKFLFIYGIAYREGVFKDLKIEDATTMMNFLTQTHIIESFNYIAIIAVLCLLYDLKESIIKVCFNNKTVNGRA